MRTKKKLMFLIPVFLLVFSLTDAQSLLIKVKEGTEEYLNINDIKKISFQSGDLLVFDFDNSVLSYPLGSVQSMIYSDTVVSAFQDFSNDEQLYFIYPNPVNDYLFFESKEQRNDLHCQLIIYSIDGKIVFNEDIQILKEVDVQVLPKGIYIAVIRNKSHIEPQKFIKR